MLQRLPYRTLWEQLAREKRMIFLSGPRQSGKTTLGKMIADGVTNHLYFNWDAPRSKAVLATNPYFFEDLPRKDTSLPLVVLDEIHKYSRWKNYLKGVYDECHESYQFLVMGSGRLDIYQRGGDSLAGRYYQFRLWPLTLAELAGRQTSWRQFIKNPLKVSADGSSELEKIWRRLERFSGFPEPYLAARPITYRRWSNAYARRLIREDVRDLTGIRSADDVELMFSLLPSKIGSPLSIQSLAEDVGAAYNTIKGWLDILERFYLLFTIPTWTPRIVRSIRKEKKTYLLNYADVEDPAARFENMVAVELLRAVSNWTDIGYGDFSLYFIRDKEKREVDFLIADKRSPVLLVETKLSDTRPSGNLVRFGDHLGVPTVQLVNEGEEFRLSSRGGRRILVAPAWQWLSRLP